MMPRMEIGLMTIFHSMMNGEDPWIEAGNKGVYSVKQRRQIIANNVDRIEVKDSEIIFYAHKMAQPQKYFARHPKDEVNFFNEGYDKMPHSIEDWRPSLIKSPDYFEEERGIIRAVWRPEKY